MHVQSLPLRNAFIEINPLVLTTAAKGGVTSTSISQVKEVMGADQPYVIEVTRTRARRSVHAFCLQSCTHSSTPDLWGLPEAKYREGRNLLVSLNTDMAHNPIWGAAEVAGDPGNMLLAQGSD